MTSERIAAVMNLRLNTTQRKKKVIDRKTEKKGRPVELTKSCRDFSQDPLIASFSIAYLLPSNTFFGSSISVLDTWILSMMADMLSASSGVASANWGTQRPLMGVEGRRYGGHHPSSTRLRMLDLCHVSLFKLGWQDLRSSMLLPCGTTGL